jgi:subfamily B ATP-binding cassette protein MsbA
VRDADLIVVLEAGRVAETGSHAALLARGGAYARLHRLQMNGGEGALAATPGA